ncbi:MAG: phenylalanine--tRNA ligase subunit alpha [Patescibacteria group bacterium]
MRRHSAGHVVHEAVMQIASELKPLRANHGKEAYIEYQGTLPIDKKYQIEQKANDIVNQNLPISAEFVSLEELQKRSSFIPEHLPKNKPLRIVTIQGFLPVPDGGTQVKQTAEVEPVTISGIENELERVRIYYVIEEEAESKQTEEIISASSFTGLLLEAQQEALSEIENSQNPPNELRLKFLGPKSELTRLTRQIRLVPQADRQQVGIVVNQVKRTIEEALQQAPSDKRQVTSETWVDVTMPGIRPPEGHLHLVTQAITEITRIFERIGFTRVRHPEVDWDWYAFTSLNMPPNHPARDEWETFFISPTPGVKQLRTPGIQKKSIVLTPHTSNGQVREMEKGKLPIRMINIAKCYRRQSDVSHVPMFHQFEGLYVDREVSISHLKGVVDYFVRQYFGPKREMRLRPFHFQFTEPSFEIDISCDLCQGKGHLPDGQSCKLCKDGWLELAGAGMVHPVVLRNGGIDPNKYSGWAFGWGVERVAMMKSGTKLDDIRLLYSNDVRFLEQF